MKEEVIGYTAGVFDLFHTGHLNLLKNAKGMCDKLIVGVTVDSLVAYKGKQAMIPFEDRQEIVRACKYVDAVVPQEDMDKLAMCKKLKASILFVGDDWYGTEKWKKYEEEFNKEGIRIVYFPYTKGVSSTKIREALKSVRGWLKGDEQGLTRIDKDFCLSSYFAHRYIYDDNVNFYEGMNYKNAKVSSDDKKVKVKTAKDIDIELTRQFNELYKKYNKIGIFLSGGIDSAILASYLKPGSNAYTFSTKLSGVFDGDVKRSDIYCEKYNLNHHYIDISFDDYKKYSPLLMKNKYAPLASIEPQLYKAALAAKENAEEIIILGLGADSIFGGLNKVISKDYDYDEFIKKYIYLDPELVLKNPVNVSEPFEKCKLPNNKFDSIKWINDVHAVEGDGSYINPFGLANLQYSSPYEQLTIDGGLDIQRVRNGEPKYLLRELYTMKYPGLEIPDKIPMPRPVDEIFKNWEGPKRKEFRDDIDMSKLTGNQKWQLWCAEEFLNMNEGEKE